MPIGSDFNISPENFPWCTLPAGLYARSFPFTPACSEQYIHIPVWVSHSTFCSKLIESVSMMACVVRLLNVFCKNERQTDRRRQRRAWVTASSWMGVAPCLTVKPYHDWSLVTEHCALYVILQISSMRSLICVLPTGHSRHCFPKFSGWRVSETPDRYCFRYLSQSLVCLSSVSWHTCSIECFAVPPKTCPVPFCILLCLSGLRGMGCGDFRLH